MRWNSHPSRVGRAETPKSNFTDDNEKWLPRREKMSPISPRSSHSHAVTAIYSVTTATTHPVSTSLATPVSTSLILTAHLIGLLT